jgi:general stress protein YciG
MAGTKAGGQAAAATNLKNDPDFYVKIGRKGGQKGKTGGFAAGEEGRRRARIYGKIGGTISRRGPAKREDSDLDLW